MTRSNPNQKCPYSPQTDPVGCLAAPNIFPLAKETFAKGKMFWNSVREVEQLLECPFYLEDTKI